MQKSYCIICGKEKKGIAVENDFVLDTIRWFKKNVTKSGKNNKLVVCKEDYKTYALSRRKFESRQKLYVIFGVLFVILSLLVSRSASTLPIAILIMLLLYLFSFLSYMPRISIKKQHNQ